MIYSVVVNCSRNGVTVLGINHLLRYGPSSFVTCDEAWLETRSQVGAVDSVFQFFDYRVEIGMPFFWNKSICVFSALSTGSVQMSASSMSVPVMSLPKHSLTLTVSMVYCESRSVRSMVIPALSE
jgi:hypothetical protein